MTKPQTSERVSKRPEFRAFWRFLDIVLADFLNLSAMMPSRNGKAAERAQLNEADMKNRKPPGRSGGSTRARRCGRNGQAKEKTSWGVRASP